MREGIEKILNSKSKTFLTFCFCFIAGSAIVSVAAVNIFVWYLYYFICALVSLLILFYSNKLYRFVLLAIIFFSIGILRFAFSTPDCTQSNNACFYNSRLVNVIGFVSAEPNEKVGATEYYVNITQIKFDNLTNNISGKIFIKTSPYPKYQYGDEIQITCKLQSPKELDTGDFRYDKYLARYGAFSVCYQPQINKLASGKGNIFLSGILTFKKNLNERLNKLWVEPESSLMAGVLYGAKSGLPQYLSDAFSKTGLSHIIAVSGYNIAIIAVVAMQILIYLGFYRQKAFYLVLVLTVAFVIFSGISASAIRAAIMGVLVLGARQVGRGSRMINVLALTVALMQLGNPYLFFWDVGFQLSFLATLGLVYLSPILNLRLEKIPLAGIREPFITTISAIVFTLPLMLYQFGTLSFIAPLVNVLVLWLVPYLMLFGAVTVALSFIFFSIAKIVAGLTYFGLHYVIIVVEFFGKQGWASAAVNIPLWLMVVLYIVLFSFIIKQNEKSKSV
ncbi:MAG: ComEC/Rec2 family competence protein [Patescibacteria group bacterium]|jgi:competence protein ComEC